MIAKEMIAEKVFAEGVAKDIRNFLPAGRSTGKTTGRKCVPSCLCRTVLQ